MSKINNFAKNFQKKERNNNDSECKDFCDILSIPSNPEDLFTLLYPIGHGAFGSVYKAVHNSTNKIYAIKIINYSKDNNKDNNNIINYNYFSVQQETSLMKLVNQSNYIVKYYGSYFSRKSNTLWLILEYCSSGSAIDLMLSMDRTFSEVEVATIMEMVLKGLVLIHSKNLIHRDIKGANILLSEDGYAKLADFGVGVHLLTEKYRKSKKGSPYWMSPQVAGNLKYDYKTDIWSLGITCIELLEGEPPFSELKPKNVMEKISKKPPNVDEIVDFNEHTYEFKSFIEHCLEIDPNKRFSAEELLKHDFITQFSKGRKYMIKLIKAHSEEVEKFRFESEEQYQKILKMNEKNKSSNNEDISDNEIIGKMNYNITYQENMDEDDLDSFDNKIGKFFDKEKNNKNLSTKNDNENIDINFQKGESEKSNGICNNETMNVYEYKNSFNNEKDNIIISEKNTKKKFYNNKSQNVLNLKIIKNCEFIINSQRNLNDNTEKSIDENKISIISGNSNNSLYEILFQNKMQKDNSKKENIEEKNGANNISKNEENMEKHSPKDSCDILFNNIEDELKTHRNREPFEFENNSNDITFLNKKENIIKEENINDSDDEGIIHETNDYGNFYKGIGIYQNFLGENPYNEKNNSIYLKHCVDKKSF